MERELNPYPVKKTSAKLDFLLQSEQDGLFFGLEFLKKFFFSKNNFEEPEITAYLKDGDCAFKGQILLTVHLQNSFLQKNKLLSAISYLSGAYTLVSCFTEKLWNFSIAGYPSPNFDLSEWEEKAIEQAGGSVQPLPKKLFCSQKSVLQALERGEQRIVLDGLKMKTKEVKTVLKNYPYREISLYGPFLPEDLEKFRGDNIHTVYPLCLQGFFPRLKYKLC